MTRQWHAARSALSFFLALSSGCKTTASNSDVKLAQLSKSQSLADFQTLAATFQSLYGPLSFKEARYGFNYNDLVTKTTALIQASSGDADTYAAITSFLATFHDGHVHISFPGNATGISNYTIGVSVTPLEGRAIVSAVDSSDTSLSAISVGDELLSVDGKKPFDLLPLIVKYDSMATDLSNQHLINEIFNRPFYMKELVPQSAQATMIFAHPSGGYYTVSAAWTKTPSFDQAALNLPTKNSVTNLLARHLYAVFNNSYATLEQMGQMTPIFATPAVLAAYHWAPVTVNATYLAKYKLTQAPQISAYTYPYNGRTILLIRQPAYDTDKTDAATLIAGYAAILDQMQGNTDVLVIDQTHNPGGDVDYATQFFQLFISSPANNEVEHLHVDRKWAYDVQQQLTQTSNAVNGALNSQAAAPGTVSPAPAPAAPPPATAASTPAVDPSLLAQLSLLQAEYSVIDNLSNNNGGPLTPTPYPLSGLNTVPPSSVFTWKKPILVMADELSGSCGDLFPMLMQRNGVAKTFGQTTMGLGGNVDDNAVVLPFTQASVDVTRGLYTTYRPDGSYSNADLVENVGIAPNYPVARTVADFRAGFVGYVKAFSDVALAQIPAGTPIAPPPPPAPAATGTPVPPAATSPLPAAPLAPPATPPAPTPAAGVDPSDD